MDLKAFEGSTLIFTAVVGMLASIFTGGFSFDMLNGPVGIYHNVDCLLKRYDQPNWIHCVIKCKLRY